MIDTFRTIEQAEDGSYYSSDAVMARYHDTSGWTITFLFRPDGLYEIVRQAIVGMSQTKATDPTRQRMAALVKTTLKAGLIVWGPGLLDSLYGSKDHEYPPKKYDKSFDLVDWYMDQFARIGVAYLMKTDTILTGSIIRWEDDNVSASVDTVSTRPVAPDKTE